MLRIIGAGLLAAAVVTWAAAQDGPVSIKFKKGVPGTVTKESKTEKAENKIVISVMGMDQTKVEGGTTKFVYTDEVIEKAPGARKATKLKRTYETADMRVKGEDVNLGLAGKTVLIEKKGDVYNFTIGGTPVGEKAAELLGKEFNRTTETDETAFLPQSPVKVGDTWKPDLPALAKELGSDGLAIDAGRSTATATLKKLYMKNGATFGVIDVALDLVVTKIGGGMDVPLKEGSRLSIRVELDGCIDGTLSTGQSKTTMKGNLAGDVMGVALTISLNATQTGTSEEVKK